MIGAGRGNEFGHFEDRELVDFHVRLLERAGRSRGEQRLPEWTACDRAEAQQLVAARCHKLRWGWKGPRTALSVDEWHKLLPDAKWIFMLRHPTLVVDSLRRRDDEGAWWWKGDTLKLRSWMLYTRQCLRFCEANPQHSLVVDLDRATARPAALTQALSQFLDHPIHEATFQGLYHPQALKRRSRFGSTFYLPIDYIAAMFLYYRIRRLSCV